MNELKLKVCGMRDPQNIDQVCDAAPDYLGFIFQPESSRYVGKEPDPLIFDRVPPSVRKVGVFVNEEPGSLVRICHCYGLVAAQLHGNETPGYAAAMKEAGLTVIKAFALHEAFSFSSLEAYLPVADYFLFDTKGKLRGGTGVKFDWKILERYQLPLPFFLSGGIGPADTGELKKIEHPQLYGIDVNSGFELQPALKDAAAVKQFINEIRNI